MARYLHKKGVQPEHQSCMQCVRVFPFLPSVQHWICCVRSRKAEHVPITDCTTYCVLCCWSGQETPGEDPYLTSEYAYLFVTGFQGGSPDSGGPGPKLEYLKASSCCKHFAVYNEENNREGFNAVINDPRDFADTYFPAFETCAGRAGASGVMCAAITQNRANIIRLTNASGFWLTTQVLPFTGSLAPQTPPSPPLLLVTSRDPRLFRSR